MKAIYLTIVVSLTVACAYTNPTQPTMPDAAIVVGTPVVSPPAVPIVLAPLHVKLAVQTAANVSPSTVMVVFNLTINLHYFHVDYDYGDGDQVWGHYAYTTAHEYPQRGTWTVNALVHDDENDRSVATSLTFTLQ